MIYKFYKKNNTRSKDLVKLRLPINPDSYRYGQRHSNNDDFVARTIYNYVLSSVFVFTDKTTYRMDNKIFDVEHPKAVKEMIENYDKTYSRSNTPLFITMYIPRCCLNSRGKQLESNQSADKV